MNKVHILLLVLALLAMPLSAQRRKRTTHSRTKAKAKVTAIKSKDKAKTADNTPTLSPAQQAIDAYRFEEAMTLLGKEIETLHKKKQNTDAAEALLQEAQAGAAKLHATERIVIIDSLVVPKDQVLKAIVLSHENGRIDTYASTYHTEDKSGATLYENELANKRYLAYPAAGKSSQLRLAVTDKLGERWSSPTPLKGLPNDDVMQNFPFLLSDGVTLYYAAKGPESMGGYDIFVTRANGEDGAFFAPENLGFPYNSTANDYMLAIDELNQLGWFVSDRRQPTGKACIYTFIPNATRELYGDETSEQELSALARITSIRDTWPSAKKADFKAATTRLESLRNGKMDVKGKAREFEFVIDDNRTYCQLADFRSPQAREKMKRWLILSKNTQTDAIMLQRLRDNYAMAKAEQRKQLEQSILWLEATHFPQLEQMKQLAKEIRNTEITHK